MNKQKTIYKNKTSNRAAVKKAVARRSHARKSTRQNSFLASIQNTTMFSNSKRFLIGLGVVLIIFALFGSTLAAHKTTNPISAKPAWMVAKATPTHAAYKIEKTIVKNTTPKQEIKSQANKTYTVAKGDTLWDIAQKEMGSGFDWHNIANANKITTPEQLAVGAKLIIPHMTKSIADTGISTKADQSVSQNKTVNTLPKTYTVQRGDSLWKISVALYNNGYMWTEIAKANNLTNPSLIFSGNVLQIPPPNSQISYK